MLELYLGGARSGKSAAAEQRAERSGLRPVYIATAQAGDAEMSARINHHRERRPGHWQTLEEPVQLAACLRREADPGRCLMVDCLTLWLTNLLLLADAEIRQRERLALLEVLPQLPGTVLLISNEVGQGVVPTDPLARRFVDESGRLHQELAQCCDRVYWVVAGLCQVLKGGA